MHRLITTAAFLSILFAACDGPETSRLDEAERLYPEFEFVDEHYGDAVWLTPAGEVCSGDISIGGYIEDADYCYSHSEGSFWPNGRKGE